MFDITDIENPLLIQSVIFPEKDISSIDVDVKGSEENNFIYLTGAYNPDFDDLELASPAVVERFIANKSNMFMHLEEPRPIEYEQADTPLNYVTNGVSVNEKLVLAANVGSGIHIAELDDAKSNILRPIGKFMFEYGSSANFIESFGNKVFVATGKGGLKILEIVEIEPTEPCGTILERIAELFPESNSIHEDGHPANILSDLTLPGTIELIADAPVYVTFVHNGAGWKNTFG